MEPRVRELLGAIQGGRVIDVATGSGQFIATLREGLGSWSEIVGIDANPAHADAFSQAFAGMPQIRFEVMDARYPAYPPESFDTASISNSLHHFARPRAVLRRVLGLLRPGGTLIVSEMYRDRQSPSQLTHVALHHLGAELDLLQEIVHRRTYRRRQLVELVAALGLDGLRIVEDDNASDDPKDPETVAEIEAAIDRALERADERAELRRRAVEVRDRLHAVGFRSATTLLGVGRKAAGA